MQSGDAPETRRDEGVFAAEGPENQAQRFEARWRRQIDFAHALLRQTEDLTATVELAYRRLLDLALQSEARRVLDRGGGAGDLAGDLGGDLRGDLAEFTKTFGAWEAVRRKLVERGLIAITTDGIAITLLETAAVIDRRGGPQR